MAQDITGRPANELDRVRDEFIRPYSDFGRVTGPDVTTTIQDAWDWSAATGRAVGQAGEFRVNGLVLRDRTRAVHPGEKTTFILPTVGSDQEQLIALDVDVVQNVTLSGFAMMGSVAGQHAMRLRAIPGTASGFLQGGMWYFTFEDLEIRDFTGEGIWVDGGHNIPGNPAAFKGPNQFGNFRRVRVFCGASDKRALRLSGQVGQVGFDESCQFDNGTSDGFPIAATSENILIERSVNISGVQESDIAPNTILFKGVTCQGNKRGMTIERANGITVLGGHFENLYEGILNSVSAYGNLVMGTDFANVGYKGDGTGYGIKNIGGKIVVRDVKWNASSPAVTPEHHYVSSFNQEIEVHGGGYDGQPIRTSGITASAITSAATIDIKTFKHVWVNGPQNTPIDTIDHGLVPGDEVVLRANSGHIVLGGGGNIDLTPYRAPLYLPNDSTVKLKWNDLVVGWKLVSLSGTSGHRRPEVVFVNFAMSPYQAIPGTGSIRVDTTGGNVVIKLPPKAFTNAGERVTVKKISADSNRVFINGATTGENPDGQGDNVIRLILQTQAMDFERNGLPTTQNWDTVAGISAPSGALGVGATLTFGAHLTGTSYDGGVPVTLGTDATSAATPNTIASRDGSGGASFGLVAATAFQLNGLVTLFHTNPAGATNYTALASPPGTFVTGAVLYLGNDGDPAAYIDASGHYFRSLAGVVTRMSLSSAGELALANGHFQFQTNSRGIKDSAGTVRLMMTTSGIDVIGNLTVSATTNLASNTFVVSSGSVTATGTVVINTATGGLGLNINDSVGNTGIGFTPVNAGSSVLFDNRRIGSQTVFRSSNSGVADRNWLIASAFGAVSFVTTAAFGGALTVNTASSSHGLVIADSSGNTGISISPANSGSSLLFDNVRVGSQVVFRVSAASPADRTWLTVNSVGTASFGNPVLMSSTLGVSGIITAAALTVSNHIQTGNPSGGTAATWRFGSRITSGVTTDFSRYLEAEVGGTFVKIMIGV